MGIARNTTTVRDPIFGLAGWQGHAVMGLLGVGSGPRQGLEPCMQLISQLSVVATVAETGVRRALL